MSALLLKSSSDIKCTVNDMHNTIIKKYIGSNNLGCIIQVDERAIDNRDRQFTVIIKSSQVPSSVSAVCILSKVGTIVNPFDNMRECQSS